jgi:alpha-galactosidase
LLRWHCQKNHLEDNTKAASSVDLTMSVVLSWESSRTIWSYHLLLSEIYSHNFASIMWARSLTLLAVASFAMALEGPVGRLPAMGYNSWNAFQCNYDAQILEAQAKVLHDRGLVDAGYKVFNFDDCYALKERNATGHMVEDPTKFPEGIAALSKRVRSYGMRLAAYGDNGYNTCGGFPGSYGREMQDLETWYSWGMTYLKYDNCCK